MKNWFSPAFILAVALLGTGEFVAREFFGRSLSGRFDYGFHPTAGFRENANGTVDLLKAGGRPFRPQKFSRAPAGNTLRIMVFGHSVPYGYYGSGQGDAPLEEVYSSIIARQLRETGIPAEGINMCINGYGPRRVQIVFQQALKYQPGIVILHVDTWSNDDLNDQRRKEFEGWSPRNWPMKLLIVRRLYEAKNERIFGKWLPKSITDQSSESAQLTKSMDQNPAGNTQQQVDDTIKITAASVAMARQQGVIVILIAQASRQTNAAGQYILGDAGLGDRLKELTGRGVYLISMKQLMEEKSSWEKLFSDHAHLNRAGHELISSAVVTLIQQEKISAPP